MGEKESKAVSSLGDFGSLRTQERTYKMNDIMGIPVTVTGFELEEGRFGEFAWLTVIKPDGTRIKVRCGGSFIIEALKEAKEKDALPVSATFVQRGNAWVVD